MSAIFGSDYWDIFAGEIHKTHCSDLHVTKPTSQTSQFPGAFYQEDTKTFHALVFKREVRGVTLTCPSTSAEQSFGYFQLWQQL